MGLLEEIQRQMAGQGMFAQPGYTDPGLSMGDLMQAPPPPGLDPSMIAQLTQQQQPQPEPAPMIEAPQQVEQMQQQPYPDPMAGIEMPQQQAPQAPPGLVAGQTTISGQQGGAPPGLEAQIVGQAGQNALDEQGYQRDAALRQAAAMEQQAAKLRAQYAVEDERNKKVEAENAAKQERLRDQQMQLASQVEEPLDGKRYFHNMNVLEKMGAIMQAATYGFLNPRAAGPSPIIQDLQQMAQEDVKMQLEDRRANGQRRAGLIDMYERQYGDATLVAKRLEADRLVTAGKMAFAEGLEAKSAEEKARAQEITAGLAGKAKQLHLEIQRATYAKPVNVSTTYVRPKPTGVGSGAAASKAYELAAKAEKAGQSKEEIAKIYQSAGVAVPTGESEISRTNREQAESKTAAADAKMDAQRKDFSAKAAKGNEAVTAAAEVVTALGGQIQPVKDDSGKVVRYVVTGALDEPHFGGEATKYDAARLRLQRADVMGMAREPSAQLQDEFAQITDLPYRDSQKKVKLQQYLDLVMRERRNLEMGYDSAVTQGNEALPPDVSSLKVR